VEKGGGYRSAPPEPPVNIVRKRDRSAHQLPPNALFASLLGGGGCRLIHAPKFFVDEYGGVPLRFGVRLLFGLRLLDVVETRGLGPLGPPYACAIEARGGWCVATALRAWVDVCAVCGSRAVFRRPLIWLR